MKLKQFLQLISEIYERHHDPRFPEDDLTVVVKTQNGGIPTSYMSPVKNAFPGMDWTAGKLIIKTEDDLVKFKTNTKNLRDIAKEHLELHKEAYAKLGWKYIAKAREKEWIDGFVEGYKQFTIATTLDKDPKNE